MSRRGSHSEDPATSWRMSLRPRGRTPRSYQTRPVRPTCPTRASFWNHNSTVRPFARSLAIRFSRRGRVFQSARGRRDRPSAGLAGSSDRRAQSSSSADVHPRCCSAPVRSSISAATSTDREGRLRIARAARCLQDYAFHSRQLRLTHRGWATGAPAVTEAIDAMLVPASLAAVARLMPSGAFAIASIRRPTPGSCSRRARRRSSPQVRSSRIISIGMAPRPPCPPVNHRILPRGTPNKVRPPRKRYKVIDSQSLEPLGGRVLPL